MKAYVFGEIRPSSVQAVLDEYNEGEPILGMMVKMKGGDKLVIGRVVGCSRSSDLVKEYIQAKQISQSKDLPPTQELLKHMEGTILEIELITAFQDNKRVPLNFLLKPLSEVHLLDEIPIPESPYKGYLGYLWGTTNKYPLILQDFQTLKEAYHFFITGQSGSGKSTLTQMLLALYNNRNPNMNFLILDTVGEFTASFQGDDKIFLPLKDIWKGTVEIYTPPKDLVLEGWDVFKEVCINYEVLNTLGIPTNSTDNVKRGINAIVDILIESVVKRTKHTSTRYMSPELVEETFKQLEKDDAMLKKDFVNRIYNTKESRDRLKETIKDSRTFQKFINELKEIAELFYTDDGKKKTIPDIIDDFSRSVVNGHPGRCVVLNFTLHIAHDSSSGLRSKYVRETLRSLYSAGIDLYNTRGDINLNTLVVLEEAHRYAPRYTEIEEERKLSNEIVKYYIETRKFGIGWACITTRPSNVRREIFENSRVKIIGMGLINGPDADLLKETFDKGFYEIYKLFPDPTDTLSSKKEICFAIHGPITTLSRQTPEFITVFNTKEEFLESNKWQ